MLTPHAALLHPLYPYLIVELLSTIMIVVALVGDLAATLEVTLKKLRRLKKVFQ